MKSYQQWFAQTASNDLTQQHTMPQPAINMMDHGHESAPAIEDDNWQASPLETSDSAKVNPSNPANVAPDKKKVVSRVIAAILVILFVISLYIVWQPTTTTSETDTTFMSDTLAVTPQAQTTTTDQPQTASADTTDTTINGNTIKLYIVGAVQHPGIYTLTSSARVYQLLQAAGGPKPDANLVALNLAAHLSDGQEIYVSRIGENSPALPTITSTSNTSSSTTSDTSSTDSTTRVNINTASADELRQQLHTTSKIAQEIVNYRLQHGPFASVDILQQVVSKSEYAKLKDMVTV